MKSGRVITIREPGCGLTAFLVLDSEVLGPAVGGIRTLPYPSEADALADARRLAQAMTVKCAVTGLDAGGGKVVIIDHPGLMRADAFRSLGEHVQGLSGAFRTAGDAGTTAADLACMAETTEYVHQDEAGLSEAVARGLIACLIAACESREDVTWPDLSIAVQGCGAIGGAVARALGRAGAAVTVTDLAPARAESTARDVGAAVAEPSTFFAIESTVAAPCALGGVVTPAVARVMRARILCGAANNVLSGPASEGVLASRGVTLVPDAIASPAPL